MGDVPIETIELYGDSVCLHNLALMETDPVERLAGLVEVLLDLVDCHPAANLRHLLVVPIIDTPGIVDSAIHRLCGCPTDHKPIGHIARTMSMPVEHDGALTTFVIASESMVRALTDDNVRSPETVSNVLETLLHASTHGKIHAICAQAAVPPPLPFLDALEVAEHPHAIDEDSLPLREGLGVGSQHSQSGYAPSAGALDSFRLPLLSKERDGVRSLSDPSNSPPFREGLGVGNPSIVRGSVRDLAASTLESYLVHRYKIAILSTTPLILLAGEDELKPVVPRLPVDLPMRLEQAAEELRATICCATTHRIDAVEGWNRVRRCLLRGVLDPLSRHAAYVQHSPSHASSALLNRSPFYHGMLATFWPRACVELQLAHDKEAEELIASLDTLVVLVSMLLTHLGVSHAATPDGHQRIDFDVRWTSTM